jgi:hypothetical protein
MNDVAKGSNTTNDITTPTANAEPAAKRPRPANPRARRHPTTAHNIAASPAHKCSAGTNDSNPQTIAIRAHLFCGWVTAAGGAVTVGAGV